MNRFLQRAHDALQASAGRLTLEQLAIRPPGKWTVGEILEHLSLTYSHTAAGAQRAVTQGKPVSRSGSLGSRFRAFIVVECGYLPTGVESPKMVVPIGIDPATALSLAMNNLREMDRALTEAGERFGTRRKLMNHPIIGPLSVGQWRRFHWVHTRHHVRQIIARSSE
jgi:hypothetical protein